MDGAVFSLDVKTVWHRWWKQLRSFYKIKRIFHDIAVGIASAYMDNIIGKQRNENIET